jgi:hypothetical protein
MKKLLFTLIILLVAGNAYACRPTAWMLGGTDVQTEGDNYIARLGLRDTTGIEFGIESDWSGLRGKAPNQAFGAYLLAELPKTPAGIPYLGGHAAIAFNDDDIGFYGPIAGTIIEITPNLDSIIEFQYLDFNGNFSAANPEVQDQYKIYAGLRFRF